jgi:hypothetical protein
MFDCYEHYNPLAAIGCPLCDKEWHQQAICEDQQATEILPPDPPGGPILQGARARADRAYQDWKWAVDTMWEDEHHCLQTVACQRHLNKQAAHKEQEAAHCQRLLNECAANKCQEAARREAAHCQRLLNEEATCHFMAECTALARKMAAAQTIFLWLCRRRLHVQLALKTSRRQQHKVALARLRYKQDCCLRAALVEEQHRQATAVQAKALANKADKQRQQDALANEQC